MRVRTTVSEAIEPLRDVRDTNVATHHHSVYWTTFSRGLGCEDLLALCRVLKPSSGDARYSPKTPSRPGLESRCCRIVRLARRMLLAPSAHRKSACGYAGQRQPLHLQASANAARAELATPKPGSQAFPNLSVPRYGSGIRPDDRALTIMPKYSGRSRTVPGSPMYRICNHARPSVTPRPRRSPKSSRRSKPGSRWRARTGCRSRSPATAHRPPPPVEAAGNTWRSVIRQGRRAPELNENKIGRNPDAPRGN
jgi:hypothetical protein